LVVLRLAAVLRVVVLLVGRAVLFLAAALRLAEAGFFKPRALILALTEAGERRSVLAIWVAVLVLYIVLSLVTSAGVQAFAPGRTFRFAVLAGFLAVRLVVFGFARRLVALFTLRIDSLLLRD
jgi:hypothetical protein